MVVNGHAHQPPSLDKLARDPDVIPRRLRVAAGVIVRAYDRGGVRQDRRLEDLAPFIT